MKKRYLIPLIILGMGAVGTATGFSVNAYYQNKLNEAQELIELKEEVQNTDLNDEEKSKLQIILDQLTEKYNEIKNIQVAGTTLGAIAAALVGALVSALPALINKSNISKALEEVDSAKEMVDEMRALGKAVQEKYEITDRNYNTVIEVLDETSKDLGVVGNSLEQLKQENAEIKAENAELKQILLLMANHAQDLVASGVAEQINRQFGNK